MNKQMLIKEIAKIYNGSTPSTANPRYWDGQIPWITPKDLSINRVRYISKGERNITDEGYKSCSTTLLPPNTVLLTSRAPIGYVSISQNTLCTNQGFKSLVCDEDKVLPLYLYYWLTTKAEFLKSISTGATFKELSKNTLERVEISLPSLNEQQHIVDTIGSVDDLIENELEKSKLLVSLGKEKYELLFEQSKVISIGNNLRFIKGKKPAFDSNQKNTKPYFSIETLENGEINQELSDGLPCNEKDLLMVMDGASSGKIFISEEGLVGSTLAKIVSDTIPLSIIYFGLSKFEQSIMVNTKGSAIPHTDKSYISELPILAYVTKKNCFYFDTIISALLVSRKKISILKHQKQTLLNRYFK